MKKLLVVAVAIGGLATISSPSFAQDAVRPGNAGCSSYFAERCRAG